MKYEVNNESIVLRCGPFHWTIVISDIRSVTEKDLDYVPLSEGWKLPGYTMFSMRFGDVGRVRMCATSMTKRIVLIETDQDVWGVTPNDVPGFVCAITGK